MAGTKASVRKEVMNYLSTHGNVDGQNPVSKLAHKINRGNDVSGVKAVIDELAAERAVFVKSDPQGRCTSIHYVHPRGTVDRTDRPYWAKKEHMFAKGRSPYLADDECGPVTIRHRDDDQSQLPAEEEVSVATNEEDDMDGLKSVPEKVPYDEVLTGALKVLRDMADENGYGDSLSISTILVEMAGMTKGQAVSAMRYLSGLGVYETTQTGYQTWSYQLDMTIERVTPEMVVAYNASKRTHSTTSAPEPQGVTGGVVLEVLHDDATAVDDDMPEVSPVEQLVAVIEALEAENAELRAQAERVSELEAEVTRLREERASLQQQFDLAVGQLDAHRGKNAELTSEVEALKTQLRQRAEVDSKVAAVLNRHADVLPKRQQPGTAR